MLKYNSLFPFWGISSRDIKNSRKKHDNLDDFLCLQCKKWGWKAISLPRIPQHFVFDERLKRWKPRQRGFAIGKIYHCRPFAGERHYLRLLLTSIRGPKSFEDIRTVNGVLYATFREACVALHLIEDDREWDRCFAEARLFATGYNLRRLFVTALLQGQLSNPSGFWNGYRDNMCYDLSHRILSLLEDDFAAQLLNQTF